MKSIIPSYILAVGVFTYRPSQVYADWLGIRVNTVDLCCNDFFQWDKITRDHTDEVHWGWLYCVRYFPFISIKTNYPVWHGY